jgi:glycosyltransferase involved in cell wall biosynthesis
VSVSICVPVYNDWENASLIIENFVSCNYKKTSLMVIDNGSYKTNESVIDRISQLDNVSITRVNTNLGLGGAIQEASKTCKSDWFVWMPGNMKVLPSELMDFLAIVSSSNSETFIKAQRINRPLIDRLKTMLASVVQTIVAGTSMLDTGGTPSAIHRTSKLWEHIARAPNDYIFDSYMLFAAKRLKLKVERPQVPYHQRLIGSSHWQSGFAAEVSLMKSLVYSIIQWRLEGLRKGKGEKW